MRLNLACYRNSLAHYTKGTPSHAIIVLRLLVGMRFQVLFHSPSGVLFTFPSRYFFAIGHQVVFSLGRWSSLLPARFLVLGSTPDHDYSPLDFGYKAFTSCGAHFHTLRLSSGFLTVSGCCNSTCLSSTPHTQRLQPCACMRFGLFLVRSPLLKESLFDFFSSGYLDVSVHRVWLLM